MIVGIPLSLLPVLLFLAALRSLDSYKLITPSRLALALGSGAFVAGVSYLVNSWFAEQGISSAALARYVGPAVEEVGKALLVAFLLRANKFGFLVDALIFGFAIGAGFAVVENVYYLNVLETSSVFTWVVRGLGTSVMHGGTTAIYAIISKALMDRTDRPSLLSFLPGLAVAFIVHSFFNHMAAQALIVTAAQLVILPPLVLISFQQSERLTRDWLGVGFDSDQEVLEMIKTGNISETRIGHYLQSLREHFSGEIIADMLCWLRIQVELSIKAKGVMLLRESGFNPPPDPVTKAKLEELKYLEESIGKTGVLAISPIVRASRRDVWQMQLLDNN
ncbi:MAG: PrsW family intramembrane metalloprotease [Rhodothermia bacterium]|nr:PrsW family intramembrane metalloprotease [Rhodothermia bacterium]